MISKEFSQYSLLECLQQLTSYFNFQGDFQTLTSGLPVQGSDLLPSYFVRACHRANITAEIKQSKLTLLESDDLPVVLLLENDCACIVYQIADDQIQLGDHTGQRKAFSIKDIEAEYTGYWISTSIAESVPVSSRNGWLLASLKPFWKTYRDVLVASLLVNLFALASPLFVMNVYDRVVPNQAYETLWVLATGVLLAYLFDFVIKLIRARLVDLAGKKVDQQLSATLMEKVLGLKLAARPGNTGSFMNNLAEFDNIRNFINSATILTLIDLPFVMLFLGLIIWIAPALAIIPLVCMLVSALLALVINRPLQKDIQTSQSLGNERQTFLLETLSGLATVKTSYSENVHQYRWEQLNQKVAAVALKIRNLQLLSSQSAMFVLQAGTILIVAYGVYLIGAGELSMGGLIAVMMISGRCTSPVVQSISLLNQYQRVRQAIDLTSSILQLPQERTESRHFLNPENLSANIAFNNVSFAYPETQPLIRELTVEINRGEKLAVLGKMGSGKTTFLSLAMGLWEPSEGGITLGGIDLRQLDPLLVRKKIGYVPQRIDVFSGSIRNNILMGRTDISDDQLVDVLNNSGLSEILSCHEQGLDFEVGEAGRHLSGGQVQSLAIARALISKPEVLLLDEPTSSMDSQTELKFRSLLAGLKNTTVILVTHKLNLLDAVDRVIVMEQGKLVVDQSSEQVRRKATIQTRHQTAEVV
ncbi:type I secretion system permease/ATPase [Endozoicomonas sp. OPT23]|uniref:type I secretion system permease/ATPase n=1 Tax=Endozoicomonas sp. OPT23 TaxID=2072845 RepID=UPI00129BD022|nr:type I secretion system permease/ATPase [Endozoicomonas sp. OPT23]MRI34740.1 type I secretion system permease/ATPase [Endozoicomonas sp. OPT23]